MELVPLQYLACEDTPSTMLIPNIFCFDSSADTDHLVAEKSADQVPHCFPFSKCRFSAFSARRLVATHNDNCFPLLEGVKPHRRGSITVLCH